MSSRIAVAYFGGSFFAEDMTVVIPDGCTDEHAYMREWIAAEHRGCLWYVLGDRMEANATFEDGSTQITVKHTLEAPRYYNGGTFIPLAELTGVFRDNMSNWPEAIGGIKCRNGWGQPFFQHDKILEVVK